MGDRIEIAGDYQHRALHSGNPVQRFWHASKLQLIDALLEPGPGDRVLDVGCGSGVCCAHMAARGAQVTGVDANPRALAFAREAYGGVLFLNGYVDQLDFPGAGFDKAICLEVVEHLYRPQVERLFEGVRGLLKPGGLLLVTTPNYRSLWPPIEFLLDRLRLVPALDGDQHVTHFHRGSLRRLAEAAGFRTEAERSICTAGPWIAPVSGRLARRATAFELAHRIPAGTILAHLYRKEP